MTIIAPPENVIAVQTDAGFERTLESLRVELPRQDFRIVRELDLNRELDSAIGLTASQYTILIVWHPFSAYQALLSNPNGGLMVPFNLAVYQSGNVTTVSVLNQPSLKVEASLGIRALGQELNRQMRRVMLESSERTPNALLNNLNQPLGPTLQLYEPRRNRNDEHNSCERPCMRHGHRIGHRRWTHRP